MKKLYSFSILLVMFAIFFLLIAGTVKDKIIKQTQVQTDYFTIDWESLYPHSNNQESELSSEDTSLVTRLEHKYTGIMNKLNDMGNIFSNHFIKYAKITEISKAIDNQLIDFNVETDYIQLKNGYWTDVEENMWDSDYIAQEADKFNALKDFTDSKDIPLLVVIPFTKNTEDSDLLPYSIFDYTNTIFDEFTSNLDDRSIHYIDLRSQLPDGDYYSYFYRTDQHWNTKAGLYAAQVIEKEMENLLNIDIDTTISDINQYTDQLYENAMFGPLGHSVGRYIEESEDFDILLPNFDTDLAVVIPNKKLNITGSLYKTMIDYEYINECIQENGSYAYSSILYNLRPLIQITNNNNPDGPKVLMVRDSYGSAVAPYLSLACSELDLIDTREGLGDFTGSIETYIEQTKPDIVIVLEYKLYDDSFE